MNHKGKFLLIIIALVSSCSIAQAQRGGGRWNMAPKESAEKQTAMMKDSLALSEAQAEKVAEVNLLYANKMAEFRTKARESEDFDRSTMRASMQAMRSEQKTELQKYLTSDQFTKWETIETNLREKRRSEGRRGGKGRKGRRGKKGEKSTEEKS